MKRTKDYQLVKEIIWADEYLMDGWDKSCTLKQRYGSYDRAHDEAFVGKENPAIEHETCTIIHKPTGDVLDTIIVK